MPTLLVLEKPEAWGLHLNGVEVVAAQEYLVNPKYHDAKRTKVFNLCKTYSYQTVGYYVSLLASARGHKPMPSAETLQDLRQASIIRIASEDLDEYIQLAFKDLKTSDFELSIYFGRNLAKRYDRLSRALFNQFPAPLLRAEFRYKEKWKLESLRPIAAGDIPESHHNFVREQAERYFDRPHGPAIIKNPYYEIGILINPEEVNAPSNDKAKAKFVKAAKMAGMQPTLIRKEDYGRVAEFDALFIRETTSVNHHTYRFARRAAAEGLIVIDDPESIVRCSNKVYLAELFKKHKISAPKTYMVHRNTMAKIEQEISFPCVVKQPDSSFSMNVSKANNITEFRSHVAEILEESELAVVQHFVPSDFDWRIGVIDGQALYACRYHFAKGDWRIQTVDHNGNKCYGKVETIAIEDAPNEVVTLAIKATAHIGDGFYGVDIKQNSEGFFVVEINDNPNIDSGYEDKILKDRLYASIINVFVKRLEARRLRLL
ncbi:MAG: RimK family protein [Deltaproteobacteria bacterium]|nr:RimK family protein [Deltaproteobacteria bacterium]